MNSGSPRVHRHHLAGLLASLLCGATLAPLDAQSKATSLSPTSLSPTSQARPAAKSLQIVDVQNGFGPLLPHRTTVPDANGQPTGQIVEIRTRAELRHLTPANGIFPGTPWPVVAVDPGGAPGSHFFVARFDRALDIDSLLSGSAADAARASLTGAIQVERVDPATGVRKTLRGRAFVGGKTYGSPDPADPTRLLLETWVAPAGPDANTAVDPRGLGFPGTEGGFAGAGLLADPRSFVFVADADDDLTTHESFPVGARLQMRITKEVLALSGEHVQDEGLASASVGADVVPPELLTGRSGVPGIVPVDGASGVDPHTNVLLRFTEPVQLLTVGPLDGRAPGSSAAVEIRYGPSSTNVSIPFTLRPRSVYDLTRLVLELAYDLPGSGPQNLGYDDFGSVTVHVNASRIEDLAANRNARARSSSFRTAQGVGLVNAPVTPDAIYVARGGANAGISVIDLNGNGQGTGTPAYSPFNPIRQGFSNFPNNPNVALQGAVLIPPLFPGTSTFNGGSEGVFTRTKESNLGDVLVRAPTLSSVGDMALGHALDSLYDNGLSSGGGNLCASTGLKRVDLVVGGPNTIAPRTSSAQFPIKIAIGAENLASWAPHPNPPPLVFPPLGLAPLILGDEPTSVLTSTPRPEGAGLTNLLAPGPFPLGIPSAHVPPQGLLTLEQNTFFQGPGVPQMSLAECVPFGMRQQIGQFLYVVDRAAGEIVVLNSNRFLVLDRIAVPDPTSLAMSPNLDLLAISSENTDQVFFLDTDPHSADFHQIVHVTAVGDGPRGIAWDSGNEDILVCCTAESSVFVLSAFSLGVRKVLTAHLNAPIDLALTPRQTAFGFARGVYLGYVLNADGTVAVFESGPDGVNGIGFDDILGLLPFQFHSPTAIQPDVTELNSGFFVLHQDPLLPNGELSGATGGALTRIALAGGPLGIVPLVPGDPPSFRGMQFGVQASVGEGALGLSGVPVDLAFDDQRNLSALTNISNPYSAGQPLSINGKSLVKALNGGALPASAPRFVFVAVPSAGVVDVLDLNTFARFDTNPFQADTQSIPVPGVTGLMNYFRQ